MLTHVREWVPSVVMQFVEANVLGRAVTFRGPYPSWQAAVDASAGYDNASIVEAAVSAARKVCRGDADYDRDGVTFHGRRIEPGVVATLLFAAARSGQRLTVLDFGGGLGSTYRQCRAMLTSVAMTWNIVEQRGFVEAGQREFETENLRFFHRIDEAVTQQLPDVVLASSVLAYVESPYETLAALTAVAAPYLVIDRTALVDRPTDILAVQNVSKTLYGERAAYPAWCLSRPRLLSQVMGEYDLVAEFNALDACYRVAGELVTPTGLFFERRSDRPSDGDTDQNHAL